jgi:Tol biopolymer transport system component
VFASNKFSFENFELFLVDAEGAKQPVRVTDSPGFDGLPVFSPDGETLSWTSNRHGGEGGQLYLARWDHAHALEALALAPARGGVEP